MTTLTFFADTNGRVSPECTKTVPVRQVSLLLLVQGTSSKAEACSATAAISCLSEALILQPRAGLLHVQYEHTCVLGIDLLLCFVQS